MKIELITLTDEMAKAFIGKNIDNRTPKKNAIERYTDSMLHGRWVLTGEAIKLDTEGHLLDGQNRCFALMKANELSDTPITIQTLLITGLDPSTQDYMDSGIVRSLKDQLTMRGMYDYAVAGTVARLVYEYENGTLTGSQSRYQPRDKILHIKWLLDNPGVEDSIRAVGHKQDSELHRPAMATAHWLISQATDDTDAVDRFFQSLKMGTDLRDGDPILALRRRSRIVASEKKIFHNSHQTIAILKCWNWWRTNTSIQHFPLTKKNGRTIDVPEKIEP